MRRLLSIVSLSVICNAVSANPAVTELANLLHFNTLQATFNQTTYGGDRVMRRASGDVSIKRPGLFRWAVSQPMQSLLIVNRSLVWNYDVDLQQATKQHLSKAQGLNAASLLSGNTDELISNFMIRKLSGQPANTEAFALKPKSQAVFKSIKISFQANKLSQMQTQNALGQKTVFDFSNVVYDKALSDKLFHFKPPAGVDVLDNDS